MLKNSKKLEKNENVITYSRFYLLPRCPLKTHINTVHCHHKIQLCSKNWPSMPTILSIIGKCQGDKTLHALVTDEISVAKA